MNSTFRSLLSMRAVVAKHATTSSGSLRPVRHIAYTQRKQRSLFFTPCLHLLCSAAFHGRHSLCATSLVCVFLFFMNETNSTPSTCGLSADKISGTQFIRIRFVFIYLIINVGCWSNFVLVLRQLNARSVYLVSFICVAKCYLANLWLRLPFPFSFALRCFRFGFGFASWSSRSRSRSIWISFSFVSFHSTLLAA